MFSSRSIDKIVSSTLFLCGLLSILTTIGIIFALSKESITFFSKVPVWEFLLGTSWAPLLEPKSFGVLPLVLGTMMVVFISSIIAIPTGVATAIYLSEYASNRVKNIIRPSLEILAGIPTIVYGYVALTLITPALKILFPEIEIFNALSASFVVGVMILPMISSLCYDALRAVPRDLREGAYALGGNSFDVVAKIMVPAAASRILAAFILAISRAIGETMAVTLAAGANPQLTFSPLKSIQTMTSYIVQVSLGDTPVGGIEYLTCFAVGSLLFVMTLLMNSLSQVVLVRFQKIK